jgi:hypothetical protein
MAESASARSSQDQGTKQAARSASERTRQPAPAGLEANILALQGAIGNRATGQLLQSAIDRQQMNVAILQRKCASCATNGGQCANCKDEETLQRKAESAAALSHPVNGVPPTVHDALNSGNGRPLDPTTRSLMESRFNHDFSRVSIHNNETANRAAASVNAAAFTVGNSIWFGHGQYQTHTNQGLYLLAHELAHTIQQRGQAPSVGRRLLIGSVNDPAETAADQAAAAVLQHGPVPALRALRPVLRRVPLPFDPREIVRQAVPQVMRTDDPNVVNVEYENNTYRVRRRVTGWREECETVETDEPARLSADFNSSDAWAQVEWCTSGGRSTRGRIRIGANVPAALQRAIRDLTSGSRDPRDALRDLDLTPFVEVDIAQSEQVRVRGRAETTVRPGTGDVRGGRGSVGVELPGATIEFDLSVTAPERPGERTDVRVGGTVTIPLERRPPRVECRRTRVCRYIPEYTLGCVQRIPEQRVPRSQERFLHFEYATDVIATRNSSTGRNRRAENNRAAEQNDREIPRLQQLLDGGWQVSSIRGFTSPEGPRQHRRESTFIGNQQLSENRANAAQHFIEGLCNPGGALSMRRRTCFSPSVRPIGDGELLTADDPATGRELEGAPLASQATTRFLQSPDEESRRTPELEQQLGAATPRQQGSLIYPLLRRAAITFTREETIPAREQQLDTCPPAVEREARGHFDRLQQRRQRR